MAFSTIHKLFCVAVIAFLLSAIACTSSKRDYVTVKGEALGTFVQVKCNTTRSVADITELIATIDQEMKASMSIFNTESRITALNNNESTELDEHLRYNIELAGRFYSLSNGAYDITVKPLTDTWGFGRDLSATNPNIDSLLEFVGYDLIAINNNTLIKEDNRTQIDLTYNSNHIEGSRLTHDQTRYIFETNTIGITTESVNVDDIIETSNHFRCIDIIIDHAEERLTEAFIKELHRVLKSGTSDSRHEWFAVGEYKCLPNEVGGNETTPPEEVHREMQALLKEYNAKHEKTLEDILDLHHRFERIHPFQDGNGRVGRLIMFKECLACGHVPFIITDDLKMFYYRGLQHWPHIKGYLMDTCLTAQDHYKELLAYFKIRY